jgi:hypothetical protein
MAVDPDRYHSELVRMRELIMSDPEVHAQFDTDGNGVIDGEEWNAVRQLVYRRLEREDYEAQLAEMLRMEADAEEEAASAAQPGPPQGTRDFSNLELAFDPRKDRVSHADQIFERELAQRRTHHAVREVRLSEHGTLADCNELILQQTGGVKQLMGKMFRREYAVKNPHGEDIGRIFQVQNEMLQDMSNLRLFSHANMNFTVEDMVSNERFEMRRSTGLGDSSVSVVNPRGRTIADTSWTLSFLRRTYEVRSVRDGVSYYVKRRMLKPWTFDILDPFEEPIGTMERGWSGLGFLTFGNLFRIEVNKDLSPDAMWGLLAAALLADIDTEQGSRKAGLDLFND